MVDYSKALGMVVSQRQMTDIRNNKQRAIVVTTNHKATVGDLLKLGTTLQFENPYFVTVTHEMFWDNARIISIEQAPTLKYIVEYESYSRDYAEDNWTDSDLVTDAKGLFNFMKKIHLHDASNRNNYPIVSHVALWRMTIEEVYVIESTGKRVGEPVKVSKQDLHIYHEAHKMYNDWCARISSFIPRIREKAKLNQKEDKEYQDYLSLKSKFESES